jgi:uncharacterized protein YuzE
VKLTKDMTRYPKLQWNWNERSVSVEFGPVPEGTVLKPLEVVLDLDEAGEALAIEVIDLAQQSGAATEAIAGNGGDPNSFPRWSYDAGSDSLYVRLRKGRSRTQRERDAKVLVTQDGRIVGLRVEWS